MDSYVLNKAIARYGKDAQITMLFEEMSELQNAVCKFGRNRSSAADIAEEIADVEIMLEQMKIIFECRGLSESIKHEKIERLRSRLEACNE